MIEIVGWSLRVPGGSNKSELWSLLKNGACSVTQIPQDRWNSFRYYHPRYSEAGKTYTFAAGVLDDLWGFDPTLFGISPREAEQMDPQQRLLLELTWEAIEDAGVAPSSLAGENVGVFVGTSALDYGAESLFDPSVATGHFMTGNTLSIIANRLSYIFDFKGPSFAVDTACSSSLVAMNEAVNALNSGRIDTAVVAGVNVLASPFPFVGFAQATMLSPDGLCKAFDADGKGYVRAEGGLVFVLRRSDAARWKGQKSHADIVGVDVNSDGRTVGMSLPSEDYQAELLTRIYEENGIKPTDLAFIEAHGTGTRVGDPAEAGSIGRVLGQARTTPLPIGSIKTNIGHLEPASGLAGVAKSILALQNNYLPASLHFDTPNPDIDFAGLNLSVASEGLALTAGKKRRYAGVNSFGFGGTNAHVILSDPSAPPLESEGPCQASILMLSAQTKDALRDLASSYAERLQSTNTTDLNVFKAAAYHRRQSLSEKLMVLGNDTKSIISSLKTFAEDETADNVIHATSESATGKCAFAFAGNGAQWAGMGVDAYERNSAFASTFDRVDAYFRPLAGWSLREALTAPQLEARLKQTSVAQPLLFAVQVALCDALAAYGLKPDMVFGHSIGEVAAAAVAQCLPLEEAVCLVYNRSIHQEKVAGSGTMAALVLPADKAEAAIRESGLKSLEVAAINSPKSVTISGSYEDVDAFAKFAKSKRYVLRKVALDYPFHSSLIEPVEAPFRASMQALNPATASVTFYSTVTGDAITGTDLTVDYWWQNLRNTVRFSEAADSILRDGATLFIEIGPKPILQGYLRQVSSEAAVSAKIIDTLQTTDSEAADPILEIVANAMANGAVVDEQSLFGANPSSPVELPTYTFQHKRFRFQSTGESNIELFRGGDHDLLGWRTDGESTVWTTHLDTKVVPFLADHVVNGQDIFPGAGYVEMMLAAGRHVYGQDEIEVQTVDLLQAMHFSEEYLTEVQTRVFPETGTVEIYSRRRLSDDAWMLNATGRVYRAVPAEPKRPQDHQRPAELIASGEEIYARARRHGLEFGPHFQRAQIISKLAQGRYRVQLSTLEESGFDRGNYNIHPAELDGCFHGLLALFEALSDHDSAGKTYIPIHFASIRQVKSGGSPELVDIRVKRVSPRSIHADFLIYDGDGDLLCSIVGGRFRATELGRRDNPADLVYRFEPKHLPLRTYAVPAEQAKHLTIGALETVLSRENSTLSQEDRERESQLLLEAAAQRSAYDAIRQLADNNGTVDLARIPIENKTFARQLIQILIESEAVSQTDNDCFELQDDFDLPEYDVLIRSVMHDNPDEVASASLLTYARRGLSNLGVPPQSPEEEPSAALLDHFWFSSPGALARTATAEAWIVPFLNAWQDGDPLRILDLAGSGLSLARFISNRVDSSLLSIVIAEPDHKSAARLQATVEAGSDIEVCDVSEGWGEVLDGRKFDLIISTGRLHHFSAAKNPLNRLAEALAENGRFVAVEGASDTLQDVVFGKKPHWFENSVSPDFPVGPMMSAQGWAMHLRTNGFAEIEASQKVISGANLSFVTATKVELSSSSDTTNTEHEPETWLILSGGTHGELETACALLNGALAKGISAKHLVSDGNAFDAKAEEHWDALLSEMGTTGHTRIIDLFGSMAIDHTAKDQIAERALVYMALAKASKGRQVQCVLVASGGPTVPSPAHISPVQSAIWAFGRTLANEAPELKPTLIDVDFRKEAKTIAAQILTAIGELGDEREASLNNNSLVVPRAVRGFSKKSWQPAKTMALSFDRPGSLDNLQWHSFERREPEANEVEIEVAATGLNFRDVMWTLGMLPEEALEDGYGGPSLGLEVSGHVTRVGSAVTSVKPGDQVIAFSSGGFATHISVPEFSVAPIPEGQDLVAAASVPVAFLTAYYSLIHLGHLREDQWVLIHGGAGGVGLAALQIAKWAGAQVIATAGSNEKRDLLKVLGADHVLDSRSLQFSREVMEITSGEGVHAVLNSLAGEAMERSLQTVRPFGCFLELGKRDYYANTKIGLRPFRRNLSYFGIDLDQILLFDQDLTGRLIKEVFELLADGTFTPLPHRRFEARSVQDAFRLMQRSGHIGKVLVVPPQSNEILVPPQRKPIQFSSAGSHLVIGGLGGFGGEIATWLADNGAREIVLTSRSGVVSDEHERVIANLGSRGVSVKVKSCDVTDRSALANLLESLRKQGPIKSIIHSAMVLDDGILTQLDEERFKKVLSPKVEGAQLLDELTRNDPLEQFILFSSATTMIGNPGQSHYVAANGFLEGIARKRRQAGFPGIAVGWGAIGDVGFLARNADVSDKLSRHLGSATIRAREGLDILLSALSQDDGAPDGAVVHVGRFDWPSAFSSLPLLKTPTFTKLSEQFSTAGDSHDQVDIHQMISGKTEKEAIEIISALLAGEIGRILRLPTDEISSTKPLAEFGMDSLMGLELRMGIQQKFGVEIPLVSITGGTNIEDFAAQILKRVGGESETQSAFDSTHENLAGQHVDASLSEEQKTALRKALEDQENKVASILQ
ncbi:SDR family NAD(P)-dependent oxidoreductase [Pseudovibrio sp. SPO723]|uniref:SDR family NAD(P)-dependent oxidoreductase n=1 Tax=Nesiotobacter zosterae TaxID=392721 RepID=UPI0029C4587B|nr:SDR family NAD(P)-dependent oxidoreductase [Pseudovibrio sp. SPO723]MDX5594363.1 SDR family NAD(P)-dependent oxidoreductase [Pseudovibrio sp. SPO723]